MLPGRARSAELHVVVVSDRADMPFRLSVDLMKASMTFLPPSVVKSPDCDLTIFMSGKFAVMALEALLALDRR